MEGPRSVEGNDGEGGESSRHGSLTSKSFPHKMHFKLLGSGCLKT